MSDPLTSLQVLCNRTGQSELDYLRLYFQITEESVGDIISAAEGIMDHFHDSGELRGEGLWRAKSIYEMCKIIDNATEKMAGRFNAQDKI